MTTTGARGSALTAPADRVARWARDGRFVEVDVDADGVITDSTLGDGEEFHTLRRAEVVGRPVQDVLDDLFAALGDNVWVADEHVTSERSDYVMGVDEGMARDMRHVVAICSVPVDADRRRVAFAVDDSHAVAAGAEPAWMTRPERDREAIETFERLEAELATWSGHEPVAVVAIDGVVAEVGGSGPVDDLGASAWPGAALADLAALLALRFGTLDASRTTSHSPLITAWEGTFGHDDGTTTTARSVSRVTADPREQRIDLVVARRVD